MRTAAQVQLAELLQIVLAHVGEQIGPDRAGAVNEMADRKALGDRVGRFRRCSCVGQVHLDPVQCRVAPIRHAQRQRDDLVAGRDQPAADRAADARTAAGDDRNRAFAHAGVSHEQLNAAQGGVAINEIDTLQFDLEGVVDHRQRVSGPGCIKILFIEPAFHVMHRRPCNVFVSRFIALLDLRDLQHVVASTSGLLRERAIPL